MDERNICRFCRKNLLAFKTKVPRVSVFSVLRNKELVTAPKQTVEISNVFTELGFCLEKGQEYPELCCLTCARQAVRCVTTLKTLTKHCNKAIRILNSDVPLLNKKECPKRAVTVHSPSGVSPSVKKTRILHLPDKTSKRSLNLSMCVEQVPCCSQKDMHDSSDRTGGVEELIDIDEKMKSSMNVVPGTETVVKVGSVVKHVSRKYYRYLLFVFTYRSSLDIRQEKSLNMSVRTFLRRKQ